MSMLQHGRCVLNRLHLRATKLFFTFWGIVVGLTRLELVTSRLSGVRSSQLSYRPNSSFKTKQCKAHINSP